MNNELFNDYEPTTEISVEEVSTAPIEETELKDAFVPPSGYSNKNYIPAAPVVIKETEQIQDVSDSDFKWYCLRTFTGHEERIQRTIEAELKRLNLQRYVREIIIPMETVYEVKKGKKKTKKRNFLPGYIVIRAIINEETKNRLIDAIVNITGVTAFVGRKNDPTPLQDSEAQNILSRVAERENVETIDLTYVEGDPVRIIAGPFEGFTGVITEVVNEKQKVKVEVMILARKTPVELDFEQIEFDRPDNN